MSGQFGVAQGKSYGRPPNRPTLATAWQQMSTTRGRGRLCLYSSVRKAATTVWGMRGPRQLIPPSKYAMICPDNDAGRDAMTPDQITRVESSFGKLAPISATAGTLFYRRRFEWDPGLRPMFTGDLSAQSRKLMAMIALVVDNLHQFATLLPQ